MGAAGQGGAGVATLDCRGLSTREINLALRRLAAESGRITVLNPDSRHNLAVALFGPAEITFEGSVGYYCGGMIDGPSLHIKGDAGWGLAENMMSGRVLVDGNAGMSAAATIRGGFVAVRGSAGARAGIAMKGGTLVVGGNVGYMTGFMMQKGTIIVCGDADEALGDSMYEGRIFVAGRIRDLGNDAVLAEMSEEDERFVATALAEAGIDAPPRFQKVVSGRRLWNFSKKEIGIWIEAL